MTIRVKMTIEQARDIVLVYRHELGPIHYGMGHGAVSKPGPTDYVRRANIECALDMVRARADEAIDRLLDEATPQARADFSHIVR